MVSQDLIFAIEEVVTQLSDIDTELQYIKLEFNSHSSRHLEVLRDLIEEIKHLRYAVDRVGR
jgi:hypothetical protein